MTKKSKTDDSNIFAFLGVFLPIIGYIIVMVSDKKDDAYAVYYAKQGLVLGIAWIAMYVLILIPIIGWILAPLLSIAILILWIVGIVYALSGEKKEIPLVGSFAKRF